MVVSMERWSGKVAIVTGASCGIGAAVAEKLVEAGLQVAGLARRSERIEELAKKLEDKKGKLYAIKADISKEEDILEAFKWVADNLGPVHILVNNAGIIQQTNLVEGNTEQWKQIMDVNVIGLCIATREAVKVMRANEIDGHIIHVNSIVGHKVAYMAFSNVYPASKYAVTALTETLRQELNQLKLKIKITSVSPGVVDTELGETGKIVMTEEMKSFMASTPKLLSKDVAEAIVYVLSTPPHVQVHELTIKPVGEMI